MYPMVKRYQEEELQGFERLSPFQKFIMVALLDPKYAEMSRRTFNQFIYQDWFGDGYSSSNSASRSRTLRKLERRGFIEGKGGCWNLTTLGADPPGLIMAVMIWHKERIVRTPLWELKGPSPEVIKLFRKFVDHYKSRHRHKALRQKRWGNGPDLRVYALRIG
jgi:hypothetical protein